MDIYEKLATVVLEECKNEFSGVELRVNLLTPVSQTIGMPATGWYIYDWKLNNAVINIYRIDSFFTRTRSKLDRTIMDAGEFLVNTGVGLNFYSLFIYVLLHEMGHVYAIRDFGRRGLIDSLNRIFKNNNDAVKSEFNSYQIDDISQGPNIYSKLYLPELLADNYAMRKFMYIWNRCQQTILIDNYVGIRGG
jgi:hypothetical protein